MDEKKTEGQLLAEEILFEGKDGAEAFTQEEYQRADEFARGYKEFLTKAKIEREAVQETVAILEKAGYRPFENGKKYTSGEKVYLNNRNKYLLFATIGRRPLSEGVRIMASHIDSPRLDLKPHPLMEDTGLAYLRTHYYGGIKKFQWPTLPLALHGVVCRKDGSTVTVTIGEDEGDPVFCITDLLPHLAKEQDKKTAAKLFDAEKFHILIGSLPFKDDKASEKVKLNMMKILHDKYGIVEGDFLSAELTMVPAGPARDVGLDQSMIGCYGHDDRVCAYTSLRAALDVTDPEYTHVTVFADKEEIGSEGNTGMKSAFMRYFLEDLAAPYGIAVRTVLSHSKCFSADVNCAHDPVYPEVTELSNSARLNYGVVITKYTGSGGKGGTNDASAEYMAWVRRILGEADVLWQSGELGKVDVGGGGTVAKFIAELNVDTVDLGVPVLSMHSPFEIVSKIDVYSTYRAFKAFAEARA